MIKIEMKFLAFIVLLAIFAYSSGGNLPYSLFYSGVLVLVFGLIHVTLQRVTMKVSLKISGDVFRTDDVISIKTVVKSFSAFPAAYMLVENQGLYNLEKNYKGDITCFNYYEKKNFLNKLEFKVRGVYDLSVTDILFSDLFSIVKVKKRFVEPKYIKVYPKVYRINENNFNGSNLLQNAFRNIGISDDSNEVRDLRLYREGDSLKRVHWKLSAKHNELYVKNFLEIASKDTNIILNMNKDESAQENPYLIEEQMVDLASSLINYLQTKKFKIKLFVNNEKEQTLSIGNRVEFQILMEYFLNNKSQGKSDLITFLDSKVTMIKPGSWIGIITISLNETLINRVMELINIGFKISIFYCVDYNLEIIKGQKSSSLEFIKCENVIFRMNE